MKWASLHLWASYEEKLIHDFIIETLSQLITTNNVNSQDEEIIISGKLRPILYKVKKEKNIVWIISPEASSYANSTSPKPSGHPDIRLSGNTPDFIQYDYDVECKLVRIKRLGKKYDYCEHYVEDGIKRFQNGKYAQSIPPMGAIVGYIQEGDITLLLESTRGFSLSKCLSDINLQGNIILHGITRMVQNLQRANDNVMLYHFWADLR